MQTLEQLQEIISAHIEQLDLNQPPADLYNPISYILSLGGKRVRPLLTLLGCNLFSEDVIPAVPASLAIEVFHNFTLLHDDIMDKADMRRGKPTVHVKWDENTAILSGDVMQIKAYQLLSEVPDAFLRPLLDIFSKTAVEVCEGQKYDMDFEGRSSVSEEEYLDMIRLKTAVLLGAAIQMGAIIGGAPEKDSNALYRFGVHVGLAFQLKDDLLDVYGDPKTFGKNIGGDILCNKKTYMLINALNKAQGEAKRELEGWISATEYEAQEKIAGVTSIYNRLGIRELCEQKIQDYAQKALSDLESVSVSDVKKSALRDLAVKLTDRKV